jgi:hypothetical protein
VGKRGPQPPPPNAPRTCTDCGLSRSIDEFVRIKACAFGWYGRCRLCRNRRARERYQSNPDFRAGGDRPLTQEQATQAGPAGDRLMPATCRRW